MFDDYEVDFSYFEAVDPDKGRFGQDPRMDPNDAIPVNRALSGTDADACFQAIADIERVKTFYTSVQARLVAHADALTGCNENYHPVSIERGTAHHVALAKHTTPHGQLSQLRRLRQMIPHMPYLFEQFEKGLLPEQHIFALLTPLDDLPTEDHVAFDAYYQDHPDLFDGLSSTKAKEVVQTYVDMIHPVERTEELNDAADERHITITKSKNHYRVNGRLTPEVGAGFKDYLDALAKDLHAKGDPRTERQLRADIVTNKVTGNDAEKPVKVKIHANIIISDRALFLGQDGKATLAGYGNLPAEYVRRMIAQCTETSSAGARSAMWSDWVVERTATTNSIAELAKDLQSNNAATVVQMGSDLDASLKARLEAFPAFRRLYTDPSGDSLVAMDSKERLFTGQLRHLIQLRDPECRTPFCTNKAAHADHIHQASQGGPTSFLNGCMKCPSCNLAKEAPGWEETVTNATPHQYIIRPTSQTTYTSTAPPLSALARVEALFESPDPRLAPIPLKKYPDIPDAPEVYDEFDDPRNPVQDMGAIRLRERILSGYYDEMLRRWDEEEANAKFDAA